MAGNPLPVKSIHHVELLVGNAKQASYFYRKAFGFSQIAYSGPETGQRDQASYVMVQGRARLVLTTPLRPDDPRSDILRQHGDGVFDIALQTDNVDTCFTEATERGARSIVLPDDVTDEFGRVRQATVGTYGDVRHTFVSVEDYAGPFLPGYRAQRRPAASVGFKTIDHIVGNVEDGKMNQWVDFYNNVFGFHQFMSFDDKDISTEHSALRSKVMSDPSGRIKFPINEPANGLRKSQIQEYLDFNIGAGVQHVAVVTDDIIHTVTLLKENGVEFLDVPESYYEELGDRVGQISEPMDHLKRLRILVDRDEGGYLLQIFTKPVEDRPTLFYEIIQRKGCQSFGKGNFKALFEAIEREQAARGNL